jgi:thiol-disulfide isomerase/thioredoxin
MFKRLWKMAVVAAFVAISCNAMANDEWVGKKAADFTVKDTKGTELTLSALAGKVVWVNFWGLRCGPCIRELPALEKLHKTYQDKGLIIIGINADGVEADFITKSFAERDDLKGAGVTFNLVPDVEFKMVDAFSLMGAPLNVIIDKTGVIRFYHEGYENGDEANYEKIVKELL